MIIFDTKFIIYVSNSNHYNFFTLNQPDYDDIDDENQVKLTERGKSGKGKDNKKYGEFYGYTIIQIYPAKHASHKSQRHITDLMTYWGHSNGFTYA